MNKFDLFLSLCDMVNVIFLFIYLWSCIFFFSSIRDLIETVCIGIEALVWSTCDLVPHQDHPSRI